MCQLMVFTRHWKFVGNICEENENHHEGTRKDKMILLKCPTNEHNNRSFRLKIAAYSGSAKATAIINLQKTKA